jgi:hypothetical protein
VEIKKKKKIHLRLLQKGGALQVNSAKWLQPVPQTKGSYMITSRQNQEQYTRLKNSKLINISNLELEEACRD